MTVDLAIKAYQNRLGEEKNSEVNDIRSEILQQFPSFAEELKQFFEDEDFFDQLRESSSSASTIEAPEQIDSFGAYTELVKIGEGGMGVVYRGRQKSPDRPVALKVIREQFSQEFDQRFSREASLAANLDHPHIVKIFEEGIQDGKRYYSMEFVDGQDLKSFVQSSSATPIQIAKIVLKVAKALEHAHQRGVIHRDIKPGNILVDSNSEPHLVDFGLARTLGQVSDESMAVSLIGTREYMSPEQARCDHEAICPATDIYSVGATLYELLTGRPPIVNENLAILLGEIQTKEPTSPRALKNTISADLNAICLKCLQKSPSDRYESSSQLIEDLKRYVENRPLKHARRLSKIESAWKWCSRNPVVSSLTGTVLVLLLILAIGGPIVAFQRQKALDAANLAQLRLANEKELVIDERDKSERLRGITENTLKIADLVIGDLFRSAQILEKYESYESGQWQKVVEGYRQLAESPFISNQTRLDYAKALNNYALVLEREQKFDLAESLLTKAIEVVETHSNETLTNRVQMVRHLINLGKVKVKLSKWSTAQEIFDRAKKLIDEHPEIYFDVQANYWSNLSAYYVGIGKSEEAKSAMRTAIKLRTEKKPQLIGDAAIKNDLALVDDIADLATIIAKSDSPNHPANHLTQAKEAVELGSKMVESDPQNTKYVESYLRSVLTLADLQKTSSPRTASDTIVSGIRATEEAMKELKHLGDVRYTLAVANQKLLYFGTQGTGASDQIYQKAIDLLRSESIDKKDKDRKTLFELQRVTYNYSNFLAQNRFPLEEEIKQLELALSTAKKVYSLGNNYAIEVINFAQICHNLASGIRDKKRKFDLFALALDLRKEATNLPDRKRAFTDGQFYGEFGGLYSDFATFHASQGDYEKADQMYTQALKKFSMQIDWGNFARNKEHFVYITKRSYASLQIVLNRFDQALVNLSWCRSYKNANHFELARRAATAVQKLGAESLDDAKIRDKFVSFSIEQIKTALNRGQAKWLQIESDPIFNLLQKEKAFQRLAAEQE